MRFKAARGMADLLPEETRHWRRLEQILLTALARYGYCEIRLPAVERGALFERLIGASSDIVNKEMYSFPDRNGELLTLRPEGTAGCARAVVEHGMLQHGTQRLFYLGPMFRYERPQRGRQRQFHQLGVELLGVAGANPEAELLALCARMWRCLGAHEKLRLEINCIGNKEARARYGAALREWLLPRRDQLDEDSRKRLDINPLRILDSKNPAVAELVADAPQLSDYIDSESAENFAQLCTQLEAMGILYQLNPRLVRGLDYYNSTVFEWLTDALGAQSAVCAGGRYDGLLEELGGKPTPACGFAIGLERLFAISSEVNAAVKGDGLHLYLTLAEGASFSAAFAFAERLRDQLPSLRLIVHTEGGSLKSQMKKADRSGARWALILGEAELAKGAATLRALRQDDEPKPQKTFSNSELEAFLVARL